MRVVLNEDDIRELIINYIKKQMNYTAKPSDISLYKCLSGIEEIRADVKITGE